MGLIFGLIKRSIKQFLCAHRNVETIYSVIDKKKDVMRLVREKVCLDCEKRIEFSIEDEGFAYSYVRDQFYNKK